MPTVLRNALAVVAGIVGGSIVNMALVSVGPSVVPLPEGADFSTMEGIAKSMPLLSPRHCLFPFLGHALGTLAGALVASQLAASRQMTWALVIGVYFLLGGIAAVTMVGGPLWFAAADLVLAYLPMAYEERVCMAEIVRSTFVLAVVDLAKSVNFYVEKLGFKEDLRVDGWSFLSRGACRLRIGDCPGIRPMSGSPDHSWFAYLHVTDARSLFEEYVERGVEIWHRLADQPWGMREFAIVTVDGHRIVFGEDLSAAAK